MHSQLVAIGGSIVVLGLGACIGIQLKRGVSSAKEVVPLAGPDGVVVA